RRPPVVGNSGPVRIRAPQFQPAHCLPGSRIPDAQPPVPVVSSPPDHPPAIAREGNLRPPAAIPFKPEQVLSGTSVPEVNEAVMAGSRDGVPVRRDGDRGDGTAVACAGLNLLALSYVPNPDRVISAPKVPARGGEFRAVRREHERRGLVGT